MTSDKESYDIVECSSPPCFMHELSPDFIAMPARTDAWTDVARWRKAERRRLLDERLLMSADERRARSERIGRNLDRVAGDIEGRIVAVYWPFRGEPDLRDWQAGAMASGARIALPVVIRKGWPLEFRIWSPGDPLERGAWNILVPAGGPPVEPDIVIAPGVGFDSDKYRLGYGGGFFDRTLAALYRKPLVIGVGYAEARVATIYPQPHDIPMNLIVTDEAD
jgi:5,10-methenyltetrahydrofolate synthetase